MLQHIEYDVDPQGHDRGGPRAQAGVGIIREHWLSFGSDALAGLRAGYRSVLVAAFDDLKLPANYHWPTDVPDNVDFETIARAVIVIERAVRMLADGDRRGSQ